MSFLIATGAAFFGSFLLVPLALHVARLFCIYAVVRERQCLVYELFGKVRWTEANPGLHFPWVHMGPFAALVPFFGRRYEVDLRLDQTYLRSQAVNSEEGAPMGIGALLKAAGLAPSTSEANRLIDGGGVRIDGHVVSDKGLKLEAGTFVVQVGKRKFARVTLA